MTRLTGRHVGLCVLYLLVSPFSLAQEPRIELGSALSSPGFAVTLPAFIETGDGCSNLQFDIGFDGAAFLPLQVLASEIPNSTHLFDWESVAPGVLRVVIFSEACELLVGVTQLEITLQVSEVAAFGHYLLALSGVAIADNQGQPVQPVDLMHGEIELVEDGVFADRWEAEFSTPGAISGVHRVTRGASGADVGSVQALVDAILGRSGDAADCNGDGVVDAFDIACLTCSDGSLRFITTWEDPGGAVIEREFAAIARLPRALDVDDAPGAELVGRIDPDPESGSVTVVIQRVNDKEPLPVRVEAIWHTGGLAGFDREYLAVGYDHLEGDAPGLFTLSTSLDESNLLLSLEQEGTSGGTTLLAGRFDGAHAARDNEIALVAGYSAAPAGAVLVLNDGDSMEVSAQQTVAGILDEMQLVFGSTGTLTGTAGQLEIRAFDVPPEWSVTLAGSGTHAQMEASGVIGHMLLALGPDTPTLPEQSWLPEDPLLDDLIQVDYESGEPGMAWRLTALEQMEVSLDPFALVLVQDHSATRALALHAAGDAGAAPFSIDALLDRPGTATEIALQLQQGEPVQLVFDNSHNMQRFELETSGLGGVGHTAWQLDNVSPKLSLCLDPGPACQRPNPHAIQRYSGADATAVSLDFDDFGTHGSGTGPGFRTNMNASIELIPDNPITLVNVGFRNLSLDFANANNNHSSNCGTIPRMSMFFDSRSHPYVINGLSFPPDLQEVHLGTAVNPARAASRITRLNGWSSGFLGCLGGASFVSAGAQSCGGQVAITASTSLGAVNVLNYLTFQLLNPCGGAVPDPQPW